MFERGGQQQVAILDWTSIQWTRTLDDTSTATVSGTTGLESDCCAALAAIFPWRHEIVIQRNGEEVWVGAIISLRTPAGTYTIEARDLTTWWDHRRVHTDIDLSEVDLAVIFQAVADDAMAPDPSPNLTVQTTACRVKGSRRILAAQHQLAAPVLRDLTNTGIDWTAVGRQVLAGGLVVPAQRLLTFHDGMFTTPPTPIRDGTTQTNSVTTRGAGGGALGDTVFATSEDKVAARLDGLIESVESVSTITDLSQITQFSDSKLAIAKLVETLEGCTLSPDAPYSIDELVPGALCPIALNETCLSVFGDYRLKGINVAATADAPEQVTLNFQPLGTTT